MASNRKPRKKARVAKVKARKPAQVPEGFGFKIPKGAKNIKVSKPKVKITRVPGNQVGAPPVDMTPPEITDTRPTTRTEPPNSLGAETVAPAAVPSDRSKTAPTPAPEAKPDEKMVQGASCTWIGPISAASEDSATGMLLCPYCGSRLLEAADEATMQLGFEAWELGVYPAANVDHPPRPHPGYRGLISWTRKQGRCWPDMVRAAAEYRDATGMNVDPTL